MDGHDYPPHHFRLMATLAEAFKPLPAEIRSHSYSPEAFGSWCLVVRCKGVRLRLIFDGRDSEYRLERSTSRKPPDEWQPTAWRMPAGSGGSLPTDQILQAVLDSAG